MATARKAKLAASPEVVTKTKAAPRRKTAATAVKKTATESKARKTTAKAKTAEVPGKTQKDIEMLAYKLWEERGCPEGTGVEDWARAEEMLLS